MFGSTRSVVRPLKLHKSIQRAVDKKRVYCTLRSRKVFMTDPEEWISVSDQMVLTNGLWSFHMSWYWFVLMRDVVWLLQSMCKLPGSLWRVLWWPVDRSRLKVSRNCFWMGKLRGWITTGTSHIKRRKLVADMITLIWKARTKKILFHWDWISACLYLY